MNEISEEIKNKARSIFKEGKVKRKLETDKRIHFEVQGETENHSVIYDKEKDEWNCDCKYFSLKEKECSHILASKLKLRQ